MKKQPKQVSLPKPTPLHADIAKAYLKGLQEVHDETSKPIALGHLVSSAMGIGVTPPTEYLMTYLLIVDKDLAARGEVVKMFSKAQESTDEMRQFVLQIIQCI